MMREGMANCTANVSLNAFVAKLILGGDGRDRYVQPGSDGTNTAVRAELFG